MFQDPSSTLISMPSASGWRTNQSDTPTVPVATLTLIVAPSSGQVGVPSDPFTVSINGRIDGDVVVTPYIISGGAGSFTPASVTLNNTTTYDALTFSPTSIGEYVVGFHNDRRLTEVTPVGYSSLESAPAPLDLSDRWLSEIHPKRPLTVTQGSIPAGVAGKAGLENKVSAHTEYAQGTSTSVVSRLLGTAYGDVSASAWTRADNLAGYKPLEIITDPDNASRSAYQQQVSQAGGGWDASHNKKMRSTLGFRGTTVANPLGTHAWIIHALRFPSYWRSITPPAKSRDWCVLLDYHLNSGGVITSKGHCTTEFFGGGEANPSASQLRLNVNWWNQAANNKLGAIETDTKVLLDSPPANTWIYVALEYSLWHGYADTSSPQIVDTSDLTVANAFVRPYVAVANGRMSAKDSHEGYWGIPYVPNSANWAYPGYWQQQLYFWPTYTPASAGTDRSMLFLGLQEYRVGDNPDPTGHQRITADDVLAAFKARMLATPS